MRLLRGGQHAWVTKHEHASIEGWGAAAGEQGKASLRACTHTDTNQTCAPLCLRGKMLRVKAWVHVHPNGPG